MALVSVEALLGKVGDAVMEAKTREELLKILLSMAIEMQHQWPRDLSEDAISDPVMFDGRVFTMRQLDCQSEFVFCVNPHLCFGCHATHLYVDDKHVSVSLGDDMLERLLWEVIP